MDPITFTAPCVPVAMPRQRHRIATAGDGSQFVANYTPRDSPANAFKASLRMACAAAYSGPPLTGPLRVSVVAVFPRPAGLRWKHKPMPRLWHAKRPDRDNVEKAVLDALKGLLFVDDAQVCDGPVQKLIAGGDEAPSVTVTVEVLQPPPACEQPGLAFE